MRRFGFLIVTIGFLITSCDSSKEAIKTNNNTPAPVVNAAEANKTSAVLWQQTSAEYEALCYQAFNIAKSKLEQNMQTSADGRRNAVIMDLDETVIDNSPYNGRLILEDLKYDENTWAEWVNQAQAELVPGAREFILLAEEYAIPVYYISDRDINSLDATMQILKKAGIRTEPQMFFLKEDPGIDGKEQRRKNVISDDIFVTMLIGDNLADFHEAFESVKTVGGRKDVLAELKDEFGDRFIILPNVMYGDWDRALELDDPGTIQNSGRGKIKYLKRY